GLALLGFLALGDVDGDAADAHDAALRVDAGSGAAGAPARLAVRPDDAEFGLLGARILRYAIDHLVQRFPVLRVHELADAVGGDGEAVRVEAENAILALVPFQFLVADRPFPGAHLTGGERQAAALLALQEPRVRGFELRGPLGDAALELDIHFLELPGLAEQLGKDPHLGAQERRYHRHRHVIHRTELIAAQPVDVFDLDRRDEDDRGLLKARVLADHLGELKAVELRHADVDQHHRDVVLEQKRQRLARRRRLHQVLVELAQNDLVGKQLFRLIVDQKDVDFLGHGGRPSDGATSAARTAAVRY